MWGSKKNDSSTMQTYLERIPCQMDVSKIKSRRCKIVIDFGNGAQVVTAKKLCEELGCDIFTMNEKIDGNFPGRGSEPTPQNLNRLSKFVVETNSDLGIAFDSDGDSSIFCDNEGKIITGDSSAILLCNYLLGKRQESNLVT